jgi:hypothetical protein
MSESASFQSAGKSSYAASDRTRAASIPAACEVLASKPFARAAPKCANAPIQQFQTMPLWLIIFLKFGGGSKSIMIDTGGVER